jgi:hypothetical protein
MNTLNILLRKLSFSSSALTDVEGVTLLMLASGKVSLPLLAQASKVAQAAMTANRHTLVMRLDKGAFMVNSLNYLFLQMRP